jgi:transposase
MSTKTDENDWAHTLAVFRACLPRRGRKAKDDRRFLEALHFFTVENVRWRALPERFGPWNSVWKLRSQKTAASGGVRGRPAGQKCEEERDG